MSTRDWLAWHDRYDEPDSGLRRRLAVVRRRFGEALDDQPAGPITVISMCAGQGRDVLPVLAAHPRRADVRARLVELDPRNAALAVAGARAAGLDAVEVVVGDAAHTAAYAGFAPADIALVCGVFGNIPADEIRATIGHLPALCRQGATVLWTRGRTAPDMTPTVRGWFAETGFTELAADAEDGFSYFVGTHRLTGRVRPFEPDVRLFEFSASA